MGVTTRKTPLETQPNPETQKKKDKSGEKCENIVRDYIGTVILKLNNA